MKELTSRLRRVFSLLKKTQPIAGEIDVVWWGPYFIPRAGPWHPSHFTLYDGTLYARILVDSSAYGLSWKIASAHVEFEHGASSGDYYNNEYFWNKALVQIEQRLTSAVKNTDRYNQFVQKKLPLRCRTGKIQRRLTWPKSTKSILPLNQIRLLEKQLTAAKALSLLKEMTTAQYLRVVGVAYDAGFKDLRSFSPLEKYKKKADSRHGGLLELSPDDSKAFFDWFHSRAWSGGHPWEIVFGHPHGIMISPRYHEESQSWNYCLWVDSEGWYKTAALMAMALCQHNVPFEFENQKQVLDALEGIDEVDVGPDLYSVHFDDLKKQRPDGLAHIRWDPIPQITLITADQKERIEKALKSVS